MHSQLESVCLSLEALANSIRTSWSDDRTLCEVLGWNLPALTKYDLAVIPDQLANDLRVADVDEVDENLELIIGQIPRKIGVFQSQNFRSSSMVAMLHKRYPLWLRQLAPIAMFYHQCFENGTRLMILS